MSSERLKDHCEIQANVIPNDIDEFERFMSVLRFTFWLEPLGYT